MSLPIHKQSFELIKRSKRPVIVLPHGCGADGYATSIALAGAFKKMKKDVDIVASDGPLPSALKFLKFEQRVRPTFGQLQKFVITLNVNKSSVEELSYDVKDGELQIYLTPRSGSWTKNDIGHKTGEFKYDLIISIGTANLERLGELFTNHNSFYFNTPIINIDHSPDNEHFGQVNIVDLTATSNGEVVYQLMEKWDHELIDADIATHLLTGMIAKTQSFKTPNVTPKTLQQASYLLKKGGRREEIVDHLFRTRSVETLRLWGRALARLKTDSSVKLVWSVLSKQDFMHAGARENELPDVIDELIKNAPDAEVVVILYEDSDKNICGLVSTGRGFDSIELALPFKPQGTRDMAKILITNSTIMEAERAVISKLTERIKERKIVM